MSLTGLDAFDRTIHRTNSWLKDLMEEDHTGELHRIKALTLIIWGDQDTFVRRSDQQILTSAIPNSQLSIYEGTGHSPQWEEPERFTSEILAFIERIETTD